MNTSGLIGPSCGWCQRSQRFEAEDLAAREIGERLVVDFELAMGERDAQVRLEQAALAQRLVHRRLVEADQAAPLALGAIEREVRILDQVGGPAGIGREEGDADAGADPHLGGRRSGTVPRAPR